MAMQNELTLRDHALDDHALRWVHRTLLTGGLRRDLVFRTRNNQSAIDQNVYTELRFETVY